MTTNWGLQTEREYLLHGVGWRVLPGYMASFVALQVWGLFGRAGNVKYVTPYLVCLDLMIVAIFDLPRFVSVGNDPSTPHFTSHIAILPIGTYIITAIPTAFNIAQTKYLVDFVARASRPSVDSASAGVSTSFSCGDGRGQCHGGE